MKWLVAAAVCLYACVARGDTGEQTVYECSMILPDTRTQFDYERTVLSDSVFSSASIDDAGRKSGAESSRPGLAFRGTLDGKWGRWAVTWHARETEGYAVVFVEFTETGRGPRTWSVDCLKR